MSADKKVTLHLTFFTKDTSEFLGKREVRHASNITMAHAMETVAKYDTMHDNGEIKMIDFSIQYEQII